jgi:hypothetical protein
MVSPIQVHYNAPTTAFVQQLMCSIADLDPDIAEQRVGEYNS